METYLQSSWSLKDLYPSQKSVEMQQALADLESASTRFERRRAMLAVDMAAEDFMEIVYELESLNRLAYKINEFAGLSFSADTQDQGAQAFLSQIQQIMAGFENRIMFFSLWWKEIDQVAASRLLEASGDFRYWLEQIRLFKPHTLTEPEEKIVNIKNSTGSNALINLYDSITNRYIFRIDVDGHTEELTRGELMIYTRSHKADLRAVAYQELYKVYEQDGPVLGQIYQTLVRDWTSEQVDLRKFPSPIAARNLLNNIPDPVVIDLIHIPRVASVMSQKLSIRINAIQP